MNKSTIAVVAVVASLGLAAFWYERNQSSEMKAALAALSKDRESLDRQVKALNRVVAEMKERPAGPVSTTGAASTGSSTAGVVYAPPARPQRVEPVATPGVTIKAPKGWAANGSNPKAFVVGIDENESLGGFPSAYVKSLESGEKGFGGMMQTISAENYAGQRVRLSGWMKTEEANDGGGHLWLRVDGENRSVPLQFDNMDGRAPKGTTDWQQYSVVLDVPPTASALAYGFFVQGSGKLWVNGAKLDAVGTDVASTNMARATTARKLPTAPVNPAFSNGP